MKSKNKMALLSKVLLLAMFCCFACNPTEELEEMQIEESLSLSSNSVKLSVSGTSASNFQSPNTPARTIDGNLGTRWSAFGKGKHITYDLGSSKLVDYVKIAWFKGNERTSSFEIWVGNSTSNLEKIKTKTTSGNTTGLETWDLPNRTVRYFRIVGRGNSVNDWNSITETQIWGTESSSGGGGNYPYDVLGLNNWKITVPKSQDGDSKADEIYVNQSDNSYSGDPSFKVYEDSRYFYTSGSSVVFKCQAGTPSTSGSSNPRSELREMVSNGSNESWWDMRSSQLRKMEIRARVVKVPNSGKVCFAQIHGNKSLGFDDIVRLQIRASANAGVGSTGTMYVIGDATNDSADDIGSYRLGDTINMRIEANNSRVRIFLNNVQVKTYSNIPSPENYFKAGVYLQSNPSSGFGQVEFSQIKTTPN
ncbi:MAG: polysaccharide lyase family 7 protein [Cyclobacteriaceae bacterium]